MAVSREAQANFEALSENRYPGRGILVGRFATGDFAQAYWVMGRSHGSRNRILKQEGGVVSTAVLDESSVSPEQLDLIKYNAMKSLGTKHVVSNGKQTDDIVEGLRYGEEFDTTLLDWSFEPDEPIYTPRISGLLISDSFVPRYALSVILRNPETGLPDRHKAKGTLGTTAGEGMCVHTYAGDAPEGEVVPSFDGKAYELPLGADVNDTAEMYWDALDKSNRVALVVKAINAKSGEISHRIINQLEQ